MLLTTSKHAGKDLQALARQLSAHLPQCRYLPRSERALERLQSLASRAGEDTILVVGSPQTERPSKLKKKKTLSPPLSVLSSRQHSSDGWSWQAKSLSIQKIKFGAPFALSREDDPLEVKLAAGKPSAALAAFLGILPGKRSPLFADSTLLLLKAGAKKAEIKLVRNLILQLDYVWC
ncbi:MAG: hypothetical protein KGH63_01245 [Candidatus Micrarchaeota archaeon]|nr:hypothetical protein [Candidatus Micrarchaeota archaeon]